MTAATPRATAANAPDPALEPGEQVIDRIHATPAAMGRGIGIAAVIFAVAVGAMQGVGPGGLAWGQLAVTVAIFAAVFAGVTWAVDRRGSWVLTDRRLIDARGRAVALSPALTIKPIVNGFRLRDGAGARMTVRSVPDPRGLAARLRAMAMARTGEVADAR